MSRTLIDKYDIKNSGMPRSSSNQNVLGYRDNLKINENYISIKLINYSSIGWVFGLAQYGITPITTSGETTEEIYFLNWEDSVVFHGNDDSLLTSTNLTVTTGYKDLQLTATDVTALLEHLLLKDPNSTYKHFNVVVESQLVETEPYNFYFELASDQTYSTQKQQLKSGFHGENIYLTSQVKTMKFFLERATTDTTYNTQIIKTITINAYDKIQPYTERFINNEFINTDNTTGTLSLGKWEGNIDDVLESKRIIFIPNSKLLAIELDLSQCNTNLDFNVDELWLSPDGTNWEKANPNEKIILEKKGDVFPLVFPFKLGSIFNGIENNFSLYYKIVSKKSGTYIDCSEENALFKINFYLA